MSFNLLDMVKDQVGGQLASKAAEMLGESESGVTKALGGVLPTVLGSVIGQGSEEGGASKIFDMVKGVDSGMLGNVTSLLDGAGDDKEGSLMNMGTGMLGGLMGNKLGGAVEMISKLGGIKSGSAMSLFKMATPFLMGGLSKKIKDDGLDASGFTSLLSSQKDIVSSAMPSGMGNLLGLGNLLGGAKNLAGGALGAAAGAIGGIAGGAKDLATGAVDGAKNVASGAVDGAKDLAAGAKNVASEAVDRGAKAVGNTAAAATGAAKKTASMATDAVKSSADAITPKKGGILRWLILALLAAAGAYLLSQTSMCKDTALGDAVGSTLEDAGSMAKDAGGAVVGGVKDAGGAVVDGAKAAGDMVADGANTLGDGAKAMFSKVNEGAKKALDGITFAAGSVGSQMKSFIEGDGSGDATFKFNNLNFNTGSADIKEASMGEIDNLAAILKAYEGVSITVEGHTDSSGDDAANMTLSQKRADSVKARLVADGVDASRIATKGYGETMPVGDNSTKEGMAMNRRIEVKINK